MDNLVLRLTEAAIWYDKIGNCTLAKLLTEAAKEIETGRLVRGAVDEGADKGRDADKRTGAGGGDNLVYDLRPATRQEGR